MLVLSSVASVVTTKIKITITYILKTQLSFTRTPAMGAHTAAYRLADQFLETSLQSYQFKTEVSYAGHRESLWRP